MPEGRIYLDYAASAPLLPAARAAMRAASRHVGNPSSTHGAGQAARARIEAARATIAETVGADPIEVVLAASGTEAVNLAIKGLFWARAVGGARRIVVPEGEHHATIDTVEWLARHAGAEIVWVPVDSLGRVRMDAYRAALAREPDRIALTTVLWANSEVGTIQPVSDLAAAAADAGVPLHVDAVAAYGVCELDLAGIRAATGATGGAGLVALSIAAHKIGGPPGVGALAVHRSAAMEALIHGGGQQRGLRSGSEDVAGALGFAAAARWTMAHRVETLTRVAALRDRLVRETLAAVPGIRCPGDPDPTGRLPGNAHFIVPECRGESVLFLLDAAGIAVSTGSACQAGVSGPSHVLLAMGYSAADADRAIRVTLGRATTAADVDAFVAAIPAAVARAVAAERSARRG